VIGAAHRCFVMFDIAERVSLFLRASQVSGFKASRH